MQCKCNANVTTRLNALHSRCNVNVAHSIAIYSSICPIVCSLTHSFIQLLNGRRCRCLTNSLVLIETSVSVLRLLLHTKPSSKVADPPLIKCLPVRRPVRLYVCLSVCTVCLCVSLSVCLCVYHGL